jgi:hypothetical protein
MQLIQKTKNFIYFFHFFKLTQKSKSCFIAFSLFSQEYTIVTLSHDTSVLEGENGPGL